MDNAAAIAITQLEQAINYWRTRSPATGEESRLCREAAALAAPYALMILYGRRQIAAGEMGEGAVSAYEAWLASNPKAP
jgi:hypothetical protein